MISMEPDDRRRRAAARQNARMPTLTRLLTSYDRAYHRDPSSPDLPLPPPAPTTTLVTELRQLQAEPLPLIQYCFRTYGSDQDAIAALDASVDLRWNCGMRRSPVGVYTSVYVADKPASAPACEEKTCMRLGWPVDAGTHYDQTVDGKLLHCGELTVAQTCGLRLQADVSSQLSGRRETWENEMRDGCPDP